MPMTSHSRVTSRWSLFLALAAAAWCVLPVLAQTPSSLYDGMRWRLIGPFRSGRIAAVVGVPGQPNVFYMDAENGGLWKTVDAGLTWAPLFTGDQNNSLGSLAVAPSNPDVIYAGSGEATMRPDLSVGDGLYKSTDAGKTWQHLGLRDGQQLASIVVDPHNADRLFVAVLGHPYGPNEERGVFRSTDGGRTFQRVLYKDENTGAAEVALDPANPEVVYAVLWAARELPAVAAGLRTSAVPGSGLFKSTDGGDTWQPDRPGAADGGRGPRSHPDGHRPEQSQPRLRQRHRRAVSLGRRRPDLPARQPRTAHRRRLPDGRARQSRRALRQPDGLVPLHGRRRDLHRHQGRPRRERLPPRVDRSSRPEDHGGRRGPGRDAHRGRRPDLELLVQPAARPGVSCRHRRPVSLPRLQRAAGQRLVRHPEPRQRRPDHLP